MPDMPDSSPVLRGAILSAAAAGAVMAVRYARKELNEPIDRSGAGLRLTPDKEAQAPVADARVPARPGEPEWARDLAGWVPKPPRGRVGRMVTYLWASPPSGVGLLIAALSGTRPVVRDGVLLFSGVRGPVAWALSQGGYAAMTMGHVVLSRGEPSSALMAHELVHTRQAERFGPFMGPVYWYLLARYGYVRHPMERAARIAGRQARHLSGGQTRPTRDGFQA